MYNSDEYDYQNYINTPTIADNVYAELIENKQSLSPQDIIKIQKYWINKVLANQNASQKLFKHLNKPHNLNRLWELIKTFNRLAEIAKWFHNINNVDEFTMFTADYTEKGDDNPISQICGKCLYKDAKMIIKKYENTLMFEDIQQSITRANVFYILFSLGFNSIYDSWIIRVDIAQSLECFKQHPLTKKLFYNTERNTFFKMINKLITDIFPVTIKYLPENCTKPYDFAWSKYKKDIDVYFIKITQ